VVAALQAQWHWEEGQCLLRQGVKVLGVYKKTQAGQGGRCPEPGC
jgi:hypothetical protein